MPHNLHNTFTPLTLASGKSGHFYSLPALEQRGHRPHLAPAGLHPHRARVRAAQLRRQEGHRGERAAARELEAQRRAHGGDPVRRRAHRAAGLHRRAAARRSRRHARRRGPHGQGPEDHRAAGAGRSRRRPLGAGRLLRPARRAGAQPGDGVPAQPRALPVPQVGHAGLRHLQGRAARHRHRPPGQPRIPRARRARRRTAFTTPTRSSAPTRTRR